MLLPKILNLQLAILFLSPVEINSERTRRNGIKLKQLEQTEDIKTLRIRKPNVEKPTVSDDDDERKTLSQQVLDGKYGLIQTELFSSPVKRPGILSYEVNPEVPKDNINNLGGLKPEEIWLAENHLLVLKGGGFRDIEHGNKIIWPPIDSYVAPQRQVKIPPNPKIPPPFPIQLKEGGPIEIIHGKNGTKAMQPYFGQPFGPSSVFRNPTHIPNQEIQDIMKSKQGNLTQGNGGVPFPFLPPGIGLFPPAIAFLPPPGNLTELDEDDPSIYYPPRYDFVYTKNYTSHVPPGPLVPGIILPPPPNFFAPLENNTKTQRTNATQKIPSSSKKLNKNRLPTVNRQRLKMPSQVNFKPKELPMFETEKNTTNVQMINKNQNKIRVNSAILNKSNEEWVPIPAPRPFYITDINKLKIITGEVPKGQFFNQELPKNGWVYENITKHKVTNENTKLYQITEIPYNFNTITSPKTVPQNIQNHQTIDNQNKYLLIDIKDKNKQLIDGKALTPNLFENSPRPPIQYHYSKPYIESNTLLSQAIYEDVTVKPPLINGRILVPNIKYEEEYRNTLKHANKPLTYVYYEQEPKYQADGGRYIYEVPQTTITTTTTDNYRTDQLTNVPLNPINKNKVNMYSTTQKPPVYEYSYSAPGYGTIEAPKIGNNFETTPKPIIYQSRFKPIKEPQFTYYEYQSTPKQNEFDFLQPNAESLYSTVQPPVNNKNKYVNVDTYQTDNPYTPYNTQEMGLFDDITKKYFTLFGKKINQQDREITTAMPPPAQDYFSKLDYHNYDSGAHNTKSPGKNIRFPEIYNIQSDRPYYERHEYTTPKDRYLKSKSNPTTQQSDNFSYLYGTSNTGLQTYQHYEPELVRPNHPLHSDIAVNYKIPNPTINPDAELIDPAYINPLPFKGNSYISYRLPGNSGHFYFLTPQTIQQNYPNEKTRISYTEPGKSDYSGRHEIVK